MNFEKNTETPDIQMSQIFNNIQMLPNRIACRRNGLNLQKLPVRTTYKQDYKQYSLNYKVTVEHMICMYQLTAHIFIL